MFNFYQNYNMGCANSTTHKAPKKCVEQLDEGLEANKANYDQGRDDQIDMLFVSEVVEENYHKMIENIMEEENLNCAA